MASKASLIAIIVGVCTAVLPTTIRYVALVLIAVISLIMSYEVPFGVARQLYLWRITLQAAVGQLFAGEILKSCRGTTAGAPRPGDTSISSEWLTKVLRASPHYHLPSSREVETVEAKGLDGNRGLAGAMTRLHITYRAASPKVTPFAEALKAELELAKKDASLPPVEAPSSLILKMSRPGIAARRSAIVHGVHREAWLYTSELGQQQSSVLPVIIYSYGSAMFGEQVILMEDLMLRGATPVNFIHGNQIWGVPTPVTPPRDPILVMQAVFTQAADMHAKYWNDRSLVNVNKWLKGADWYNGQGRIPWELAIDASKRAWADTKAKTAAATPEMIAEKKVVQLSPKLVSIMDRSLSSASWSKMVTHLKSHPFTLCHGDFHAANMLLLNSSDQTLDGIKAGLRWFDWSEVGPWEGPTDLAQTIISDMKAEVFREHGRALLDVYYNRLVANGVKDYSRDQCFKDFSRGGAERWIWVFAILTSMPMVPAICSQYFHDQLLAFIETFGEQPEYQLKPVVQVLGQM